MESAEFQIRIVLLALAAVFFAGLGLPGLGLSGMLWSGGDGW
jgi:multisubunit Na+/H+ antiporter MnhB subunit